MSWRSLLIRFTRQHKHWQLLFICTALLSLTWSCSFIFPEATTPTITATLIRRPTVTRTHTATRTTSPSPSPSATASPTPSPTETATQTLTFTPQPTRSNTPSATPIPATLTPAPNQITQGFDVWQLQAIKLTPTIRVLDTLISPQSYNQSPGGYLFLVMEFECLTDTSLIALFDLREYGLTFVHKRDGYPQLWLEDDQRRTFPVNLIGTCWLAAPAPPDVKSVSLYYNGQVFRPTLPVFPAPN